MVGTIGGGVEVASVIVGVSVVVLVLVSLVLGNIFGFVSEKLAGVLTGSAEAEV